jgi:hypothetical protein
MVYLLGSAVSEKLVIRNEQTSLNSITGNVYFLIDARRTDCLFTGDLKCARLIIIRHQHYHVTDAINFVT